MKKHVFHHRQDETSDAHMEAWLLGKHKYPKGYWL